jgi:hypothetical protein
MARPSHKDMLARYRKQVDQSKRWRREEKYDALWGRMIDLYRGKHYDTLSNEDRLLVNIAFSTVNVIGPSVSVNHPKITVGARRPQDADRATITEAIINYWWRHYDCQPEVRLAVDDFLIIGHGWLKAGYRFVEKQQPKVVDPEAVAEGAYVDELALETEDASSIESDTVVVEDRPFLERVSPFDMYVDPNATSMRDMKWIAQRIRRPLMEVKADKRYNKKAREECSPSTWSKWSQEGDRPRQSRDKSDGFVDVWEFYDISKGIMCVFADGGDNFLIPPTKMPYADGHPYEMMRNYDIPDYFYPMGELEAIEPLQHELNATRTQMMNHRKRFSRKWLYKESAFDRDGRSSLESDEDNVMVPVVSDEPLGNVVAPMPAVINPPDMYNLSSTILGDIDRISGVGEFMRGGASEISRTATEAAMMQDAMNARTSDKLATIERTTAKCASRLIGLAQQYLTGEHAARVVGSNAMPLWVKFDRDYIKGDFDFEVEAGSTQPVNESFRRQMALQMVDAMAPFLGAGVVDMAALARHILQFGFGVKAPEAFLAAPNPMMGQQGAPQGSPVPAEGGMPVEQMPMPPTGGMPMPSSIPPQVLATLASQGTPLNNTQAM